MQKSNNTEYKVSQVTATMSMEGLILTEENKQTLRDCFDGKKSFAEARKEAIAKHAKGHSNG